MVSEKYCMEMVFVCVCVCVGVKMASDSRSSSTIATVDDDVTATPRCKVCSVSYEI